MFYPGLPARRHAGGARSASRRCGAPTLDPEPGPDRRRDHERRERSARSAACTSWARTRRCPIPTSITRARRWPTLDHLVVQDIFLTETAYLADVVLPATAWPEKIGTVTNTDRMVQLGRKAIEPPGDAQAGPLDHQRAGARAWASTGTTRTRATCSTRCASAWTRSPASPGSGSSASRRSPIRARRKAIPGEPVVFIENFPTADRPRASSCRPTSSPRPSGRTREYPMVLITGRQLEHWHTGAMTRRAAVLDYIEPEPVASVHPLDLDAARRRRRATTLTDRVAARQRSRSTRAPTTACRAARCSSRSATTRRRRTC